MPTMFFIGNLNYVAIAVIGGLRVASGTMNLGDVQAFIQYTRMFTQPLTQVASMANLLQSGVASAERVFEDTGRRGSRRSRTPVSPEPDPWPSRVRARLVLLRHCVIATGTTPLNPRTRRYPVGTTPLNPASR